LLLDELREFPPRRSTVNAAEKSPQLAQPHTGDIGAVTEERNHFVPVLFQQKANIPNDDLFPAEFGVFIMNEDNPHQGTLSKVEKRFI